MKKFLATGVAGLVLMVAAGTQVASAAPWRPAYRGYVHSRPIYRTTYNHHRYLTQPYVYGHEYHGGYGYGYNGGCW